MRKKLLRKRVLIPLLLAVMLAIAVFAVGAAFGWWYTDAAPISGNNVGSGTATLISGGGPISATNLVPQLAPAATANDSAYGGVSYVYVQNTGSVPLMFYAYIDGGGGTPSADFLSKVDVSISLLGATTAPAYWTGLPPAWSADTFGGSTGPYPVWSGTLADLWNGGQAFGAANLGSVSGVTPTPIGTGEVGIYRIAVWLDSTAAAPDTQGQSASFSLEFHAIELQQWVANGNQF